MRSAINADGRGRRWSSGTRRIGRLRLLDVTDPDQWARVVRAVIERWGRLDILVNAAGIGIAGPIEQTPFEDHLKVLDVNVNGVYLGMREVAAPMRRQGGGSIVNISSINGLSGSAQRHQLRGDEIRGDGHDAFRRLRIRP